MPGNDFDEAIVSMMSENSRDHHLGQCTPTSQNRSRSISKLSDDSRLLAPTVASAHNIYQRSPGPIWEPPAHIITPPSAKLRRPTKATEAQRYDESKRRPVTPKREAGYRKYMNATEAQNLLHTDADTLYTSNSNRSSRQRMRSTSRPKYGDGSSSSNYDNSNNSTGKQRSTSASRRSEESVVNRPTTSSVNHRYRKEAEESIIWQKPDVIREPSVQLTKSTPGIDAHKPTTRKPMSSVQKREAAWSKPYQTHAHSILDLAHLNEREKLFQKNLQRRDKSTDRSSRTIYTSNRFEALTTPNAARKADADALRKMREEKKPKSIKKQSLLTNQRIVQPTMANLASKDELEYMRNSIRASDDPFWDKRQGRELPQRDASVERKLASTPSKLHHPTFATLYGSAKKYTPPPPPSMRAKSPTPILKPPTERLLQETKNGIERIKAGVEVRSQSARSVGSGAGGGSSVVSSRSLSSTVSERLTKTTKSYEHSTWKAKTSTPGRMRSRSAGSMRDFSPDLIERLERKTASIHEKRWMGSEKQLQELLYREKIRRGLECTKPIHPTLLVDTSSISTFRRGVFKAEEKKKDALDVGEGWYEKHHVPTDAEIRAGNHLHNHIGELTSRNYDKYQHLTRKSNGTGNNSSSRNSTPGRKSPGKENENTRQSPSNFQREVHDDSDNFQELNASDEDGGQPASTSTKSSDPGNVKVKAGEALESKLSVGTKEVAASVGGDYDAEDGFEVYNNGSTSSRRSSGDYSENSIAIA